MTFPSNASFSSRSVVLGVLMAVACLGATCLGSSNARANDFNLFGGFAGHPPASRPLSYAPDGW